MSFCPSRFYGNGAQNVHQFSFCLRYITMLPSTDSFQGISFLRSNRDNIINYNRWWKNHDRHLAVNSRAVAILMSIFVRRIIERKTNWGRIINIRADCAWGCPKEISYCASKYASESYSRSAAAEVGAGRLHPLPDAGYGPIPNPCKCPMSRCFPNLSVAVIRPWSQNLEPIS